MISHNSSKSLKYTNIVTSYKLCRRLHHLGCETICVYCHKRAKNNETKATAAPQTGYDAAESMDGAGAGARSTSCAAVAVM